MYKYIGLHVECPLFLSDFGETSIFWTDFSKDIQISNLMKISLVGAEVFHADRRDEADSRFSQFFERAYEQF
jgi:hypothetical protein